MYTHNVEIYKTIWLFINTDFYNNRTKDLFIIHSTRFCSGSQVVLSGANELGRITEKIFCGLH